VCGKKKITLQSTKLKKSFLNYNPLLSSVGKKKQKETMSGLWLLHLQPGVGWKERPQIISLYFKGVLDGHLTPAVGHQWSSSSHPLEISQTSSTCN